MDKTPLPVFALPGGVRELLQTDWVTPSTRKVLTERMTPPLAPVFFSPTEWATLQAAARCLLPKSTMPNGPAPEEAAHWIDDRLARGDGDGWRYDALPPDGEAYRLGLRGLDETAQARFACSFVDLDGAQCAAVLSAVQKGEAEGAAWKMLSPVRFFEELLAELVARWYSHPLIQEEIGYAGMADAHGWQRVGLNDPEPHEPLPVVAAPPSEEAQPTKSSAREAWLKAAALPLAQSNRAGWPPEASPSQRFPTTETVDAVVIGTGAGGAPLLARLAQAGLRVVALEAGKQWNPAADFATDEVEQNKLFWRDERLSAGESPVAFGSNNSGTGVGGSTLVFTAYTPRPQPDDFRLYSDFGVGADWPLSYGDLEPYLGEVEQFLGVSGVSPYPWGPKRTSGYPLPPLPLNGAALLMERACKEMGIRTSPAANAALSAPYFQKGVGWRNPCTNRGFCQTGCSVGAKASMDVTFIPLAVSFGAEIRSECFATRIETDKTGAVCAVVYTQNGVEERQPCRAVFLCAGAVETPRLLLMNDLCNSSGQVGRNFMAHPGIQVWGQFDEDVRPYKGIPGGLISEDTHRPKDADFAGGYLLQSIGVMPVTYVGQMARGRGLWGEPLGTHMRNYNHIAGINILGEGLPYEHNYLELSNEKDARGLPKPRIHYSAGQNEKRMNAHAEALMCELWKTAGGRDMWSFERYAHTIGTCRMGTNPAASVVDPKGASHDVPGLYVCDNSVFPSTLAVNPSLTIMALSLRTADAFLAQLRRDS